MEQMDLDGVACPACGVPAIGGQKGTLFCCRNCKVELDLASALCASCHNLNLAGHRLCARCGARLVHHCPNCHHENWAGNEVCEECGCLLDLLEVMTQPSVRDTTVRLRAQQQEAEHIKQRERDQSEARLAEFWRQEEQRLQVEAKRSAKQKEHETRLMLFVGLAAVLVVVIMVLFTLIGS